MAAHHTYHGANVRILYAGSGLDGRLIVQRYNPLSNDWIDARTFHESSDYCYTEAKAFAASLAYCLQQGEAKHVQKVSVLN
jgi:hypothetical protein